MGEISEAWTLRARRSAGRQTAWVVLALVLIMTVVAVASAGAAGGPSDPCWHCAGLVVQFGDGNYLTRCVDFREDQISGVELLQRSGLRAILQISEGTGGGVCRIEGEGCAYPDEPCFCQCMGGPVCLYWAYFVRSGSSWAYSGVGAGLRLLSDGDMDAWTWGGGAPPPPALSIEDICHDRTRISVGYPRMDVLGSDLTVVAPFEGDENSNGLASLRLRPLGGGWDQPVAMVRGDSAFSATMRGVQDGRYEVEVSYGDPDGVNGSACWIRTIDVGVPLGHSLFLPVVLAEDAE